jgi:hypothetical protein
VVLHREQGSRRTAGHADLGADVLDQITSPLPRLHPREPTPHRAHQVTKSGCRTRSCAGQIRPSSTGTGPRSSTRPTATGRGGRGVSCCSEPQSLATIRLNTVGDREQSPAAEVIAVRARLASLTAAAVQPKARRAQLTAARKAHELADLLSMCVSKPRSIIWRRKHPALKLHCSSPNTYRRKTQIPSRLEPADRQAALQVLRDLEASSSRRAEGYPQVLVHGDGFEVGVAS